MAFLIYLITTCSSCFLFSLANRQCFPEFARPNRPLSGYDEWRWRNIFVSLLHSSISGISAFLLSTDVESVRNSMLSRHVLCLSIGYFLYDFMLSLSCLRIYPDRVEIIVHHVITTVTLGLAIFDTPLLTTLMPFCVFGLVVELSNVFIHIRSLMNIIKEFDNRDDRNRSHRTNCLYRLNSVAVLASIVVFRFLPLFRISVDVFALFRKESIPLQISVQLPTISICLISVVIFWRIMQQDFAGILMHILSRKNKIETNKEF